MLIKIEDILSLDIFFNHTIRKFHNIRKRANKDSYREVNKILQHPLGLASSMPPR